MRRKRWNGDVLIPLGHLRTDVVATAGRFAPAVYVPLVRLGRFHELYVECDLQGDTSHEIKLYKALFSYEDGELYPQGAVQCQIAGHLKIRFSLAIDWSFAIGEPEPRFVLAAEELAVIGTVTSRRETWIAFQELLMKLMLFAAAVALGWNFLSQRFPGK